MSVTKYVWVMEWYDALEASPRRQYDVYSMEPQAGVNEDDFEKFMIREMFPAVDIPVDRLTAGRSYVVRHYLLKQVGSFGADQGGVFPDDVRDQSILRKSFSLSTTTASHFFDLVGSWEIKESQANHE